MFFKIDALKCFGNFTGKQLSWSLFKEIAGWRLTILLKRLQRRYFSVKFAKFFKNTYFTQALRWLLNFTSSGCFCIFLKKYLNSHFATLLWRTNNFSSRHIFWCIKSWARLFISLSSIVRFSKYLCQGVPYEAENWHAWSHEQYFSKHRFLDICRCAFNLLLFPFLQNFWHEIAATRNQTKFWQRFFFHCRLEIPC